MRSFLLLAVLMAVAHSAPIVSTTANDHDSDDFSGFNLNNVAAPADHDASVTRSLAHNANANHHSHRQVMQDHRPNHLVGTRRG